MSLKKELIGPRGATISYWKIVRATPNFLTGKTEVALYGYESSEQRAAYPNDPPDSRALVIDYAMESRALIYAELMGATKMVDGQSVGKYEFYGAEEI